MSNNTDDPQPMSQPMCRAISKKKEHITTHEACKVCVCGDQRGLLEAVSTKMRAVPGSDNKS